jgi:transcriptional regulator with XRE-family HTH domain
MAMSKSDVVREKAPLLGPRLRELRNKKGVTGDVAALAIGVRPNHLYCVERGEKLLSLEAVRRAADFYGVDFAWLLEVPKPKRRK